MTPPRVVVVIPARYGSTRLPGKPLVSLVGKPMIQRVYERARLAQRVNRVIVATDDDRIVKAVEEFDGEARMTRHDHRTGTERVAEVAAHETGDIYVNVQGDEPLLDPAAVDAAVSALLEEPQAAIATVATPVRTPADIMDPNVCKVVLDFDENALYFSRAPIPGCGIPAAMSRPATSSTWACTSFVAMPCLSTQPYRKASWNGLSSSSSYVGSRTAGRFASPKSRTTPSAWTCPRTSPASRSFWPESDAPPCLAVPALAGRVLPQERISP